MIAKNDHSRHPDQEALDILAQQIAGELQQDDERPGPVPGLTLFRLSTPKPAARFLYEPCISLIVQGGKDVSFGDEVHSFHAGQFLLSSIDIPTFAQVSQASVSQPYLSLTYKLDISMIREILSVQDIPIAPSRSAAKGLSGGTASHEMISVFSRLLALKNSPRDVPMMSGLLQRELLYRLLVGDEGARLRQISLAGSSANRLGMVLQKIKENYAAPLRIEDLANEAAMAVSTFHHQFRGMTGMSPLQYQKSLRLHVARSLMLTDSVDAATAAIRVGYESASQFNREYSRFFGSPPLRDIKALRQPVAP